jgi:hypothetical protein
MRLGSHRQTYSFITLVQTAIATAHFLSIAIFIIQKNYGIYSKHCFLFSIPSSCFIYFKLFFFRRIWQIRDLSVSIFFIFLFFSSRLYPGFKIIN